MSSTVLNNVFNKCIILIDLGKYLTKLATVILYTENMREILKLSLF